MVDLSIIVLSFNTRELLRNCLSSVRIDLARVAYDVELIVVDNASVDGSTEMTASEFPEAKLIMNIQNLGFSKGNNIGLAQAQGRYLLCLNSDTLIQPGALAALIEFMESHPDAGAIGPMLLNEDGSLQPSGRALPNAFTVFLGMSKLYRFWSNDFYHQRGRDYNKVQEVQEISGAALCVRREAYEMTRGFDENLWAYYEDVDWCVRIAKVGYKIYFVPQAKILHLWKRSSQKTPELVYRAGQNSQRYYFRKHTGRIQAAFVDAMLGVKEIINVLAAFAQGDKHRAAFHRSMLANLSRPPAISSMP